MSFPGGELEGQRPRSLCPACRDDLNRAAGAERSSWPIGGSSTSRARTLCFQCYRADIEHNRALSAAGQLNTATTERFQGQLPFESVDTSRLQMSEAERPAIEFAISGCRDRHSGPLPLPDRAVAVAAAIHAAELQLPESWLPFVV